MSTRLLLRIIIIGTLSVVKQFLVLDTQIKRFALKQTYGSMVLDSRRRKLSLERAGLFEPEVLLAGTKKKKKKKHLLRLMIMWTSD